MPFVRHSDAADGGNGAATNAHDFITNNLIPFITSSTHFPSASDRWTLERTDVVDTNEEELFISPPSNAPDAPVISFHTRDDTIYMFAGTSYVAGVESYALPGNTRQFPGIISTINPEWDPTLNDDRKSCTWTNIWPTSGLTAHWLYAPSNGAYCYAIIQIAARRYRHIIFGQYDKYSSLMTGGEFFGALFWNQNVAQIDNPYTGDRRHSSALVTSNASSLSGKQSGAFRAVGLRSGAGTGPSAEWHMNGPGGSGVPVSNTVRPSSGTWDTTNNTAIDLGQGNCNVLGEGGPGSSFLYQIQQSILSNLKPLLPITIWCLGFSDSQDRFMPVGQMPDMFRINLSGFSEGQDLVIGSDTYSLFPVINSDQINTLSDEEYSGFDGIAILQSP